MNTAKGPNWEHNRSKYCNDETAHEYDQLRYAGFRGRWKNALHERVLRKAFRDVPRGSRVVDIPCGTGRFTQWLLDQGYQVTGIDISPNMLDVARKKIEGTPEARADFQVGDIENLPYENKSIDATLTARFFHLVPASLRPKVYAELGRITKSRIILCFNCNKWSLKILSKRIRGKNSPYWMSRKELTQELNDAGLKVLEILTKGGPLSTLWVVVCEPAG